MPCSSPCYSWTLPPHQNQEPQIKCFLLQVALVVVFLHSNRKRRVKPNFYHLKHSIGVLEKIATKKNLFNTYFFQHKWKSFNSFLWEAGIANLLTFDTFCLLQGSYSRTIQSRYPSKKTHQKISMLLSKLMIFVLGHIHNYSWPHTAHR